MDLETNQNNVVAKLPLLKQRDYETWKIKIVQFFQIQDYDLWELIENGNSLKPVVRTTTNKDGTSTSTIPGPVTTEEKIQKKNDVKARSMLLMVLPNEHLLTFNQHKDAKTLFEAIQARFGGNDATKKTQKTLLKHMYENFNAPSTESLDSIFNRLQKIASQLAILGEIISQEDLNFKFLRSLPAEWNTHVNVAFVSTPSSTNDVNTTSVQVSTVSTPVSTTSSNSANLSDATVYAFLENQPDGSHLVHEDLEQIYEADLEAMDLNWQLALLSMRARRYYQRTGKKITINGSDVAGYDKLKVECFNCHKMGHFARECRGPRNQDSRPRNQESSRKTVVVEDTSAKGMIAIDGAGFDWSFMADKEVPTNMALMAISDSEVLNDKTCSNSCLKNDETLKNQYDNLRIEFNKSEFDLANYKRGLASVEEQLVFYKKNEVAFCDQIAVLKRDASFKDSKINALKFQIENLKKEKESSQFKINSYENASKSLDTLLGSQITYKSRKGVGFDNYNAVAPPPTDLFAPPSIDLSYSGLEEFQQPEFKRYGIKVSDSDEDESDFREIKNVQPKPKQANEPRKISEIPRNNSTNWNKPMSKKLGVLNNVKKGTGQREVRPVWNNAMRTNHQNFSNVRRDFAPTVVLTKSGLVPISTARQSSLRAAVPVSTARPINTTASKTFVNDAKPKPNVFQKLHSPSKRPFYQQTALKNRILNNKVNTIKVNSVNTAKGKSVTSAVGEPRSNAVKSSACWVWRPKGDPHVALKDTRIFDSGCSRHMTGNKSYLTDYQDYDGGFVAFADSSKGGKITRKCNIRTEHLDFEDVYFVKELKFNLFSVSQMCDRKNNVLFTETKCLILSPNFKLPDENQVMLKIPRKDNMYSFDLKNIVPSKVRGLPSKLFENDHTCVACQKGKQHKASCIENQLNHKVKIIRCDNGTEFKNYEMNQFCGIKGIKREFGNARTLQQNGAAERKNRTLIEAVRTITPIISFMRPFGCPVTILNTLDHLGKFDGKVDEGFLVGYSINNKAVRVFNSRTKKVEENMHVNFFENKPNIAGSGPEWLFDIDSLTNTMNYQPVSAGNRTNGNAGLETNSDVGQAGKEKATEEDKSSPKDDAGKKNEVKDPTKEDDMNGSGEATHANSTNRLNTVSSTVNTDDNNTYRVFTPVNAATPSNADYPIDPLMPDLEDTANLEDTGIFGNAYDDEDVGTEADINNLETTISVSPVPTTKIHKDHPKGQIIGEVDYAVQTRRMHKQNEAGLITFINKQRRTNHKDFQNFLFAWFLSHMEPKKVTQDLDNESWVEAIQEELLQFKLLNVWTLVDLPHGKKAIGTKWVFRNKKDQRGIVVRNKARLVAQGHRQEKDIDYDEMDVKSDFLYGTIEDEVYVSQPPGFLDPEFPNRVYKVEKALYGLYQAPKASYETLSTYLLENGFRRGTIDKTLIIKKIKNGILLVQVYVDDIIFGSIKKSLSTEFKQLMHKRFQVSSMGELTFFLSVKIASTPIETHKPLSKDADGTDVDVHLYRSMIGSLMYLTSSMPDIMFAVCACSIFQVQPKASHMHAMKKIFRYLKGQPTLGLWYPKNLPLELIAYSNSDYSGASLDRKSTTGGCQFLGCRDSYEKKLIEMVKIHTDYNVADLLTKAFDVTRFQILIASIDNKELAIPGQTTTGKEFSNPLMADSLPKTILPTNFLGCLEHNMVAFLQKPTGSEEFHQIVEFLAGSHIRYALTANPTIYASLIEQFWQTATVKTVNNGEQ
ncbi:putative ribonuclease H-like domain-containing protein [Tanacetum coccineum]